MRVADGKKGDTRDSGPGPAFTCSGDASTLRFSFACRELLWDYSLAPRCIHLQNNSTPLHLAAMFGNAAVIRALLGDPRVSLEEKDKVGKDTLGSAGECSTTASRRPSVAVGPDSSGPCTAEQLGRDRKDSGGRPQSRTLTADVVLFNDRCVVYPLRCIMRLKTRRHPGSGAAGGMSAPLYEAPNVQRGCL